MAPLSDAATREARLADGCCPNCGTRLYKVSNGGTVMSKVLRKKAGGSPAAAAKRTPLTIPGVVDRGQCVKCADGHNVEGGEGAVGSAVGVGVEVPAVKAVPVVVQPPPATASADAPPPGENGGTTKPPPPQDNPSNLKPPPEDLIGLYDAGAQDSSDAKPAAAPAAAARKGVSVDGSSSEEESSSGSEETDSDSGSEYTDDSSLEDVPMLEMNISRMESDHASSALVNSLKLHDGLTDADMNELDDRKPPAKPVPSATEKMNDVDLAFLESAGDNPKNLACPDGMSPEVFYQLPPEMQREVMGQGSGGGKKSEGTSSSADIDPETLASLPDDVRREVLEQARREQQSKISTADGKPAAIVRPTVDSKKAKNSLSQSTTAFLTSCDIDADDFENFPEEVKKDILEQRRLSSQSAMKQSARKLVTAMEEDLDRSGYDPETLASLPPEMRKEVLEEERRQRERRRREREEADSKRPSVVGAHSVNVPAGYDPETFEALPEDVKQELLEEARQQGRYAAEGFDHDGIAGARVVQARPMGSGGGTATSCTYTGEYNMMGKRHGDGELKWANGDVYVGKFKDGYIEGRGTISFHDGTEYAGQWKRNRFHGEGTRRFNNGNVYTGNYESGKRQGQGRCYFANGDMYVGDWKDDTIHGFGRYYYNNGHSFEGMFRNGKRNGRGKYQLTDGRVEIYRYVNDARVGDGVRWSANRKKAWRMNDGKVTKKVSIEEASAIANRCGPVVEES